jgi:hypothetical protein
LFLSAFFTKSLFSNKKSGPGITQPCAWVAV